MATDAAKHTIPAGTDGMRRQNLLDLSLSINDIIPVANATERDSVYAALVAAGRVPASAPVRVDRLDTGLLERNTGTGWGPVSGLPVQRWGVAGFLATGRALMFAGTISTDTGGVSQVFDVHTVMGTVLTASFMATGASHGAGVSATLYDTNPNAVRLRIWVGSTPQASVSFPASFILFGVA